MNEIERYVERVCNGLGGSLSLRKHIREELKEHLDEAIEGYVADGLSREEAEKKAIDDFGEPGALRRDMESVHGHSLLALVVDRAMEWKEETMKSGWKWNFVALFGLGLLIAAEVVLLVAPVVFLVPLYRYWMESVGASMNTGMNTYVSAVVFFHNNWWGIVIPFVLAWGLFERKVKSDNKPVIRLALGMFLAVGLMAVVFLVTIATHAMFVGTVMAHRDFQAETAVSAEYEKAASSYKRLRSAFDAENWTEANETARDVIKEFGRIGDRSSSALALASLHRKEDLPEIRLLISEIAELSHEVYRDIRDGRHDAASRRMEEFEKAWNRLGRLIEYRQDDGA